MRGTRKERTIENEGTGRKEIEELRDTGLGETIEKGILETNEGGGRKK